MPWHNTGMILGEGVVGSSVAFGSFLPEGGSVFAWLGEWTAVMLCAGLLIPREFSSAAQFKNC